MEKSSNKAIEIKCPECLNIMKAFLYNDESVRGTCNRCKSSIIKEKRSAKEKRIRIIKI